MKRASKLIVWLVFISLGAACGGCAREEPSIEIPLNKIWGYQMPGTLDIETLEPDHFGPAARQRLEQNPTDLYNSSLSHQIYMAIGCQVDKKQPIGPGFAVAGTGHEALAAVKKIMEQDQISPQIFPVGTEVSLFFFTRDCWPLKLKNVAMLDNTISIRYQHVPHALNRAYATVSYRYFALIPLGKLPVGNYAVDMVQTTERKYTGQGFETVGKEVGEKRVCKSFAFVIIGRDEEESNHP